MSNNENENNIGWLRTIAPHLKDKDDEELEAFLEDAGVKVKLMGVPQEYEEILTRWLAAHLASLGNRQSESHSVADLSVSYSTGQLGAGLLGTPFGQEFWRIIKMIRPKLRVM